MNLKNCGDKQISNYVSNFLMDYFWLAILLSIFFNLSVSGEMRDKNQLFIHDGKIKNMAL